MLEKLKSLIRLNIIYALYFGGLVVAIVSIYKKAELGFFIVVGLISQPNIWYKFQSLPMGKDFLDLMFLAVLIVIFINKRPLTINKNLFLIFLLLFFSYLSLWNSSMRNSLPYPISTSNELVIIWKNFAMMILMYFVGINVIKSEQHQKVVIFIIALVILNISLRNYRSFAAGASFIDEHRLIGPFWVVKLGSNHFGAFIADYSVAIFGLALFNIERKMKWLCMGTALLSIHSLLFSFSRGAYVGALFAVLFFGICKKRSILVLFAIIFICYHTLLPPSVVERISMTKNESGELETSAASRLELWNSALGLMKESPIYGVGFDGFRLYREKQYDTHLTDTHNYFIKNLCEGGIIGFTLLLLILFAAFQSGWTLYKKGSSQFQKGLGLGFLGSFLSLLATNMFGDRFSYVELGSFFWILWSLVDRGIIISNEITGKKDNQNKEIKPKKILLV
jgi:O-antigen ligase